MGRTARMASSLLKQAHGYRIIGAQLDIMNENGHSIMSFTRMPPSLVSVDWYLQQHRAADGPGLLTPEDGMT